MKLNPNVVLLNTLSKPLYYLILAFSLVVFWRGHNNPGGGFIAGLLATVGTLLWAIAHGSESAKRHLPLCSPLYLAATGVLTAAAAGVPSVINGQGFLHHAWVSFAGIDWSTTQLFDLGVYLCVWGGVGGVTLELLALGDEDYRRQYASQSVQSTQEARAAQAAQVQQTAQDAQAGQMHTASGQATEGETV